MSMKSLSARLQYNGGSQLDRIRLNKLRSFRAALTNNYNTRMIKTQLHSCYPCIISPYLQKSDYTRDTISVEFESGLRAGDTFECLDDGTHWMIYLPKLTETAYLRSEIIQCRYTLTIDDVVYWIYMQSATETDIRWFQKSGINMNELNLSGTIYIKKDKRTQHFFHRFDVLKIADRRWQVQVVDDITVPGIIELEIQEYYNNDIEEFPSVVVEGCHDIMGRLSVEQDHEYGYQIRDSFYNPDAKWSVENNPRVEILETLDDGHMCRVKVHDGAIRKFDLVYGNKNDVHKITCKIVREFNGVKGPKVVYPYDIVEYSAEVAGGYTLNCGKDVAKIISHDDTSCKVEIVTSRKGNFIITFNPDEYDTTVSTEVTIKSL